MPCSNAAKTWNQLKFAGVSQTPKPISAVSGPSSPYYEDMWRRYCCLTSFFRLSISALVAKIQPDKVVRWCPRSRHFGDFLGPAFPASCAQHVSDLQSKFTLGPHHVPKYGIHPIFDRWDYARKKKKIETTGWKYNGLPYYTGRP